MAEFVMPALGADMEASTLVKWCKQPGDTITHGEVIAEIDSDKGVIEVECFTTGVIEKQRVQVGKKVPVGTPRALIYFAGQAPAPSAVPVVEAKRQKASPVARKLAQSLGVGLAAVTGTGKVAYQWSFTGNSSARIETEIEFEIHV